MTQRRIRHAKILEIISEREIETQQELCDALNAQNILATQATISRDINELHLTKVVGEEKRYKYVYSGGGESGLSIKMSNLFKESVVSVKNADNIIVLKTLSGNGSNAGTVIDKLAYSEVLGCVAGDDTLIIVCESASGAQLVVERLKRLCE